MEQERTEGTTPFLTDSDERITKDMPVFYNPVMKFNRDLSLAMLLTMDRPRIGLPMEASGVRAARILHELVGPGHLDPKEIAVNDRSDLAIQFAKRNLARVRGTYSEERIHFTTKDASIFLREAIGFDYIDIDPFGTPNPFLDAAVQRVARSGIIAVTATDTSALAGTYPAATARKYWSVPSRTWAMHEFGLRILIRKVQLVAAQYEIALLPVLSVATDHYYRVFFTRDKSHATVKPLLKEHGMVGVCNTCLTITPKPWDEGNACPGCNGKQTLAGPMWLGRLHDPERVEMLQEACKKLEPKTAKDLEKFFGLIADECVVPSVGFVCLHELASRQKKQAPRTDAVLAALKGHACRTHISGSGIKTDLPVAEIVKVI
jgi:tRNA (guanine26-N2/guanine27-N2)-dimethyltransferase